jgi:hypothetical protein
MRELKTRRVISEWLTLELNAQPGCEETKVTKYQLVESDTEGCNRSRVLSLNYGRDDSLVVHQKLRPLFEEARRRFNVFEP